MGAFLSHSAPVFSGEDEAVSTPISWTKSHYKNLEPAYHFALLGDNGLPSDQILKEQNANDPRPLASLSKIMTVYLALEAMQKRGQQLDHILDLTELGHLSESRFAAIKSRKCSLANAISGTFVQSNNYLAKALAIYVAESEAKFTHLMNRKARAFGLTDTYFINASGLPDKTHGELNRRDSVSTVRDASLLLARLVKDFPQSEFMELLTQHKVSLPRDKLIPGRASVSRFQSPHTVSIFGKSGHANKCSSMSVLVDVNKDQKPDAVLSILCGGARYRDRNKLAFHLLNIFQAQVTEYAERVKIQEDSGELTQAFIAPFPVPAPVVELSFDSREYD